MGSLISSKSDMPDQSGVNNQQGVYRSIASGTAPTVADKAYGQMSNNALGNTLSTIGSQKSFSPSNMAGIAGQQGANMQMLAAAQGGVMKQQDIANANSILMNSLMGQSSEQIKNNQYNAGQANAMTGTMMKGVAGLGATGVMANAGGGGVAGQASSMTPGETDEFINNQSNWK